MLDAGFALSKRGLEFERRQGECLHIFRVQVHKLPTWYKVVPEVYVSCPKINKTLNDILGRNAKLTGPTFGFGVSNRCDHKRGLYSIEADDDIPLVAEKVLSDFFEIALPWYSGIEDVPSVDSRMNGKSDNGRYVPQSVSYACRGIIAAHLAGNTNVEEIADQYYHFCVDAQSVALAQPILTVRQYLRAVGELATK